MCGSEFAAVVVAVVAVGAVVVAALAVVRVEIARGQFLPSANRITHHFIIAGCGGATSSSAVRRPKVLRVGNRRPVWRALRLAGLAEFPNLPQNRTHLLRSFWGRRAFFVIFCCVCVCVCVWCNTKQQTTTGTKTNEGSSLLQLDLKIRGACSDCLALGLGPARPHAPATWQQRVLIADRRAATV